MATRRMLVDATHPEETRIVVTHGNRLEEFDFESASRRQLRGNIYLAKVTRVEPSLQAAFIEYGGNRHGFLAFSEIHPDYYQIPVADREALLRDEAAEIERSESPEPAAEAEESESDDNGNGDDDQDAPRSDQSVDSVGAGDALEELPERRKPIARRYKIQEVIKRRQVMLVQVVKEERGNKGAALTTYLSLAGRYSVLMPNTARGGGISRKITSAQDRKRLKDIAGDLEVPQGMGVILRTAGASRTKAEVKRDFEYLLRLWENVRNLTLESQAPCLVYEEGSLIKRTIRDLYNKDIDEVLVSGDDAYREAKDFMRMIMPSHAKNVQAYRDDQPIFSKYSVEAQLDSMFSPQVTLPSGGYIVINPTEALVSIDVNSGRATKEHNIEDTALQTNLEAADEVARQLRLRDLAGLIVIDFIDMMEKRSNRNVERRLKDALKNDRARIQIGRISHFGLMEMSRQRMRFGVLESSTHTCPTCAGTGIVRSVESVALMVMRAVEDHVLRKPGQSINVRVPTEVALYILNSKRHSLTEMEAKHDLSITIAADAGLVGHAFAIERGAARQVPVAAASHVSVDSAVMDEVEEDEAEDAGEQEDAQAREGGERRRRRRRGRRGEDGEARRPEPAQAGDDGDEDETEAPPREAAGEDADGDGQRKRRRRGRRGGRRNRRGEEIAEAGERAAESEAEAPESADEPDLIADAGDAGAIPEVPEAVAEDEIAEVAAEAEEPPAKPKRVRRTRKKKDEEAVAAEPAPAEEPEPAADEEPVAGASPLPDDAFSPEPAEDPVPEAGPDAAPAGNGDEDAPPPRRPRKVIPEGEIVVTSTAEEAAAEKPKRAGWWQRRG